MLNTSPPGWLKDVQELTSPEIDQLEADIKSGTLTEEAAKPLLLAAGARAAGKALSGEALSGEAPAAAP